MSWKHWHKEGEYYVNDKEFTYHSPRYNKHITVAKGYVSDGATGARDVDTSAWWCHDVVKQYDVFDDNSTCSNLQASYILYDILKSEGYWFRARSWFISTLAWGTVVK